MRAADCLRWFSWIRSGWDFNGRREFPARIKLVPEWDCLKEALEISFMGGRREANLPRPLLRGVSLVKEGLTGYGFK